MCRNFFDFLLLLIFWLTPGLICYNHPTHPLKAFSILFYKSFASSVAFLITIIFLFLNFFYNCVFGLSLPLRWITRHGKSPRGTAHYLLTLRRLFQFIPWCSTTVGTKKPMRGWSRLWITITVCAISMQFTAALWPNPSGTTCKTCTWYDDPGLLHCRQRSRCGLRMCHGQLPCEDVAKIGYCIVILDGPHRKRSVKRVKDRHVLSWAADPRRMY